MLWLAKICKPSAWKEFYYLIGHTIFEFREFLSRQSGRERSLESWKVFVNQREKGEGESHQYRIPKAISSKLNILDESDAATLVELYQKWVIFFAVI